MKTVSYLLVFLLLLQSCSVYNIPSTVEAAVVADKKVKITTTDNQKYKFKRLEKKNDRLIGITGLESTTANKLAGTPAQINGKNLELDLSGLDIEEVELRNRSQSTAYTVVTIIGTLAVAFLAVFYISFATSDWAFGEGSE